MKIVIKNGDAEKVIDKIHLEVYQKFGWYEKKSTARFAA